MNVFYLICLFVTICVVNGKMRPRGVSISMASKYQPNERNKFNCINGFGEIPYDHLNDDYCDCDDGTDEPGTSACANGKFHCTNAGYIPKYIQSSRVNDGVCDCCDGTDEYGGKIECVNNCKELGKAMREEQDQKRRLHEEGFKKRDGFIAEVKRIMEEKNVKIQELEKEKAELEVRLKELEALKAEHEGPEKEAKDRHEQVWKEQKEAKEKERSALRAREAFDDLDLNKDGFCDILEIIPHMEFDIDSNGIVSEEEAKEHLEDQEKVDFDEFSSKIWGNIQGIYKKLVPEEEKKETPPPVEPQGETETLVPPEEPQATPHVTPPPDEGEDYEDDDGEDEDESKLLETTTSMENVELPENAELFPPEEEEHVDEEKMPEYDEETKALIAAADEARKKYEEADKRSKDIDGEITSLTSYLNTDYGKDKEFAVLRDQCYEYTDREYTYKLCPFSTASQRPKSGGHETNLGRWGRWEDDHYKTMVYDHGQNCWNGPDRSVKVHITCGPEHQLTNAYEPSRCEYAFDFVTPCACNQPPPVHDKDPHDEL
ncbi:glucosidase 2 subunit beta-like isoform X1 [Saccostrea echinata]|uniref:glucosidase 2 subunit beta-like isoform X1 n=1 Tax=Saccostrea echinata TaxID=191078 RepID=UPI002A819CD2|nr:glucosidase 2 subunit beta-like isoform X1 [Saccostrea echinata]